MSITWHRRFLELAQLVASWSKDPSTQVGAVTVDEKRRIVATGYNGFPRGIDDTALRLNDRPTKYEFVVHAEANAILNSTQSDLDGCSLYITHAPCTECAKLIIQAGIGTVYVPTSSRVPTWAEAQEKARRMLEEALISTVHVTMAED